MHYPLSELDPEFQLDYVPVRAGSDVPQEAVEGFWQALPAPEELTGEFLARWRPSTEGWPPTGRPLASPALVAAEAGHRSGITRAFSCTVCPGLASAANLSPLLQS